MRLRITIDLIRNRPGPEAEPPPGMTDGGAQIETAPDTAPGWNRVGFVLPSTNEEEPE
ncbi:hypothetical protein [Kocuria rhizophila]|uniref:hypothetical protein n=1 Tax=Kocuria rhizophila TaxID=72000 RepID=UPI003D6FF80D